MVVGVAAGSNSLKAPESFMATLGCVARGARSSDQVASVEGDERLGLQRWSGYGLVC